MRPFRQVSAPVCALPQANVDTDQLIPARFMKRPRSEGYGNFLLYDTRFDEAGAPRVNPVDEALTRGAQVMVARRKFGSGSSREAAVYALVDAGFRCVIAPSFGDIFAGNAVNNGLLPAVVDEACVEALLGADTVCVDLEACRVVAGDAALPFRIDPVWRVKLLNGWSDIDLTLSHAEAIRAFAQADRSRRPWARLDSN